MKTGTAATPSAATGETQLVKAKTILVAEDGDLMRELLDMGLKEQGMNVRTARDGEEAIKSIEEEKPDLLLLDLLMPKLNGYAVLKHINKMKYTFPVIVLSNLSDLMEEKECKRLGVKEYIVKSNYYEEELWERIKKYL